MLISPHFPPALLAAAAVAGLIALWYGQYALRQRWLARRREQIRKRIQQRATAREQHAQHDFRAVSIISSRPACKLARRYQSVRFLNAEAPRLPLAGCPLDNCRCRYQHYADRRSEERRNPFGIDHVPIGIEHNRRVGDRRRFTAMMAGDLVQLS